MGSSVSDRSTTRRATDRWAIFSSRERAEQFIARDPFVLEGIAHPGDIRQWDALNYR
nr:hypothetical protein [Rhodococcus wratislaviensis]